jgi:hypothetical protein
MLPTEIRDRHSRLTLLQDRNDPFFAEPVSRGWSPIQTEGTPRRNVINQSE